MRDTNLKPFVIMAVESVYSTPQREADSLINAYGGNWRPVEGCYKGEREDAYIVTLEDHVTLAHCVAIAAANHQESLLLVDEQRRAHLHYIDSGKVEHLGAFVECQPAQAGDAYTIADGRYYHCR